MPSANPKQATEAVEDPIRQVIRFLEHKIRNLEKRKTKLESYKETQDSGKELNQDQKIAVAKYNEVVQTLDTTREIHKATFTIANDHAKQQKKLARKEALERNQQEIAKIREAMFIQNTLMNISTVKCGMASADFLYGINGAPKLTEEELRCLDTVINELNLARKPKPDEPNFGHRLQKYAEHVAAIIDGKPREFAGFTYAKVKEVITNINESGFLDQFRYSTESESAVNEQTEETTSESRISNAQAPEQATTEEFNPGEVYIPPPESLISATNLPVQVSQVPVVSGPTPVSGPLPVVAQPIPPHPASNLDNAYYVNAASYVPSSQPAPQTQQGLPPPPQQQQQQQPQQAQQHQTQQQQQQQAPRINDVIGNPDFFFLQESELDSPDVTGQNAPIVSHIPPAVNAPIPTQTFTNQNFAGAPVQVIYPHPPPPQDMPHIPGFANPNPPPPIPMPPSHQQQNIPYSPQHPAGFQQQAPNSQQMQQPYDPNAHQQDSQHSIEDKIEQPQQGQEGVVSVEQNANESSDWNQLNESSLDEWGKSEVQDSAQISQQQSQQSQQAWGELRGGYRGRGNRRGNSNGYNGRGRGGSYQQNGRGGSGGQGTYYRNDSSNYQNGYQQRNYNNEGNAGYNGGFIKQQGRGGGSSGSRGAPRGERGGMDRGGRGGQFRGGQRGGNRGGNSGYVSRKAQAQQ